MIVPLVGMSDNAHACMLNQKQKPNSMGKTIRIFSFILALALAIVGAVGAIYVLFFAAGGNFKTAGASALILGAGLIWLSDLIDAPSA